MRPLQKIGRGNPWLPIKMGRHGGLPLRLIIFLDEKIRSKNYSVLFTLLIEKIKIDLIIVENFLEEK
jgi:hypothetical protein